MYPYQTYHAIWGLISRVSRTLRTASPSILGSPKYGILFSRGEVGWAIFSQSWILSQNQTGYQI